MAEDRYTETFETWNKVANLYQEKFMYLDLYNDSYDFFCDALPMNDPNVLELACGPGNITKYLISKRPDMKVLATDVAPAMIELAKKNNPSADFAVMDCRELNQLQTKFEAVVCGFCLPYLSSEDCKKLIQDVAHRLAPKGLLYLSFVEGETEKSGYQKGSTGDRTYFYYHNLEEIKTDLLTSNFELVKVFKVAYNKPGAETDYHTILISMKA